MNLVVNAVQKFGSLQQISAPDKQANTSVPKIQQQPIKDTFEKSKDETSVGIFYIADLHGKMTNMERICIRIMRKILDFTHSAVRFG